MCVYLEIIVIPHRRCSMWNFLWHSTITTHSISLQGSIGSFFFIFAVLIWLNPEKLSTCGIINVPIENLKSWFKRSNLAIILNQVAITHTPQIPKMNNFLQPHNNVIGGSILQPNLILATFSAFLHGGIHSSGNKINNS